jgi:cytochrome P450
MSLKLPPGPKTGFLGLAAVREIKRDLLGYFQRLRRDYGDTVYMRLGPFRDYTFFHPDQIHELLVEKAKHFIRMPRPIQVLRQWNGDGILITEGEIWQRHRRILQPAFSPKRIASYAEAMVSAIGNALDKLPTRSESVDIEEVMNDMTTAAICRTMFGTDLGVERQDVRRAVKILSKTAVDEMFALFTWPDWLPLESKRQKRWAMKLLDDTVLGFVKQGRNRTAPQADLLSMLLTATDAEGDGSGLTDEQVRDQSMTIFLAGHDTTAAGLVWACWALAAHPDVQEQTQVEINGVLGNRLPTFADLPQLPYCEAVIKETLRHWPPAVAVFGRQATRDVEIGGYPIPKGSVCRVISYVTQHDERWFPEPNRFDPKRWLDDAPATIPSHAYLPFGAGPRACIGKDFAIAEMVLAVAMIMQKFQLKTMPGQQQPAMDPSMSLRPIGGLQLQICPR